MRVKNRSIVLAAALVAGVLGSPACSTRDRPTAPEPEPDPPTTTETFMGDIDQNESSCHSFTLVADGDVTLLITSLQPLPTLTVGLGLGQPDTAAATGCSLFVQDDNVRTNQSLLASNLQAGDYCSCIFDVGNIFPGETVTYSFDVTHP